MEISNILSRSLAAFVTSLAMLTAPALLPAAQASPNCDTAGAVGNDCVFLRVMASNGLNFPEPDEAISLAKEVCNDLQDGRSTNALAAEFLRDNPSWKAQQAFAFVGIAMNVYCPSG
jgi:hypothetical protein